MKKVEPDGHKPGETEEPDDTIYDFNDYPDCPVKASGSNIIFRLWRISDKTAGGLIKPDSVKEKEQREVGTKPVKVVSIGNRVKDHDPNIKEGTFVLIDLPHGMQPHFIPDIVTGHVYYGIVNVNSIAAYSNDAETIEAAVKKSQQKADASVMPRTPIFNATDDKVVN